VEKAKGIVMVRSEDRRKGRPVHPFTMSQAKIDIERKLLHSLFRDSGGRGQGEACFQSRANQGVI
jgi:hypothetical protein